MALNSVQRWARKIRKDSVADGYAILRDQLDRDDLPDSPELLVEGTIQVVIASAAYASLDGRPFDAFLKMQPYDPAKAPGAVYALTFDLYGHAFGRVLCPEKIVILDLADLYDHPWDEYGVCTVRKALPKASFLAAKIFRPPFPYRARPPSATFVLP